MGSLTDGTKIDDLAKRIKCNLIMQFMQAIEALLEYLTTVNFPDNNKNVKNLFERYTALEGAFVSCG